MLHTKFYGNRPAGSSEKDFCRVFTIYVHGGHLGHVTSITSRNFHFNIRGWSVKYEDISPSNIHCHQVLHICHVELIIVLCASCTGYDTVAFCVPIPPLHRSRSYNVGVNYICFLMFCPFDTHATYKKFISKFYFYLA